MNIKTKTGIGIALVVLMVAALAAPVSADYDADDTKMNIYKQSAGDLDYTYGTPFYTCINTSETATYNVDLSHITPQQMDKLKEARLYVYWTWSLYDEGGTSSHGDDVATYPALNVTFNGVPVSFDYAPSTNWIDHYTDAKNIAAIGEHKYLPDGTKNPKYVAWNWPSGTNCSTVNQKSVQADNVVTVTNEYPYTGGYFNGAKVCIQGVGLLLIFEQKSDEKTWYWIAEGNDMTYVYWHTKQYIWKYDRSPEDATTRVTFTKNDDVKRISEATLTSVIPAGDLANNRLYFNYFYNYWDGPWCAIPNGNLSVSVTDVSANYLPYGDNIAGFQNGLSKVLGGNVPGGDKQMNVANAFLVVKK